MSDVLTFRAADELWAVPLNDVDEVVAVSKVTPLPLLPAKFAGIIDVHGRTVPAIGYGKAGTSAIVLRDFSLALLVSSIRDVVSSDAVDPDRVIDPGRLLEEIA